MVDGNVDIKKECELYYKLLESATQAGPYIVFLDPKRFFFSNVKICSGNDLIMRIIIQF